MENVTRLTKLKRIYGLSLNYHKMSRVDPAVLSAVVSLCEDVHLYMCKLTNTQVVSIHSVQ